MTIYLCFSPKTDKISYNNLIRGYLANCPVFREIANSLIIFEIIDVLKKFYSIKIALKYTMKHFHYAWTHRPSVMMALIKQNSIKLDAHSNRKGYKNYSYWIRKRKIKKEGITETQTFIEVNKEKWRICCLLLRLVVSSINGIIKL